MSKKYVITDPYYILPEEDRRKCCDYADKTSKEDHEDWSEIFHTAVEMALTRFTQGQAWVNSTLFGDWTNRMYGPNVIQDRFCADSGMVSVCEYNDKVKEATKDLPEYCFAIIEADDDIKVSFDESVSDWCVVEIESSFGNFHSEYPMEEDEE